jgi:hypothetical protein
MSRNYKKLLTRFCVEQPNIHLWRAIILAIAASLILFTAFFAVHPKVISVTADAPGIDEFDFARDADVGNYDELARDADAGNYDELARDGTGGAVDELAQEARGNLDLLIAAADTPGHDMLIREDSGNYDQLAK